MRYSRARAGDGLAVSPRRTTPFRDATLELRLHRVSTACLVVARDALSRLRARGVALDGLRALGAPGLRVWLLHEGDARNMVCRIGRPSHDAVSPSPEDVPIAWRGAPYLHVAPMPFERQRAMVASLGGGARFVSVDPHLALSEHTLDAWRTVLAGADALFASDDEMRLAGAGERPVEALRALAVGRMRYVVHKRGARGGSLYDARADALFMWEPVPALAVDVTGAGDAFAAGFLSALRDGLAVEGAIARGAASASAAVEGGGAEAMLACARADLEARAAKCVVRRLA